VKSFDNLRTSLVLKNVQGDIRRPNDHAMEHVPKGFSRWYAASGYIHDITRILLELKMATSFVEKVPDEQFFKDHSINPEDYIMYHQGYFLDLVHQLKDKLIQMLYAILKPDREYSDKKTNNLKHSKIKNLTLVAQIKGLEDLLEPWDAYRPEDPTKLKHPITISLKKRTGYHHYKNPLTNQENYFQTKSSRFLLAPDFFKHLSDYGVQMVTERSKKTLEAWQKETHQKMSETLKVVEENVDSIAKAISGYLKMPYDSNTRKGKSILLQVMPMDGKVKIPPSKRVLDELPEIMKKTYDLIYKHALEVLKEDFVAMYAVGSATRGDFILGVSDVNGILIIKNEDHGFKRDLRIALGVMPNSFGVPVKIEVYSHTEFQTSETAQTERARFACKTDGILIGGEDLLKNQKDFRKSFKTVWMLNKDFRTKLEGAKVWLTTQSEPGATLAYEVMARYLAKRAFHLAFGQIMGNEAVYAVRYKDMRDLANFYMPANKHFTDHSYKLVTNRLKIDRESLEAMIEAYERTLIPLYEAINKGINGPDGVSISTTDTPAK